MEELPKGRFGCLLLGDSKFTSIGWNLVARSFAQQRT